MNAWPDGMTVAPIREWPGALTARRQRSNFSASWSATLSLLTSELRHLGAKDRELLVAIRPEDFRLDGKPRANAKQEHPGVILSFDAKVGHLSYAVDTFDRWQDNVRGIAKSLEALRMVDRYGTTKHGEQYRGFMAIEAAAAPSGFATVDEALHFIGILAQAEPDRANARAVRAVMRAAQRAAHPDADGDAATFQRVSLAEAKLREEGLL
jgi:hypothetical protein